MKQQRCIVCGKQRQLVTIATASKWICKSCQQRLAHLVNNPEDRPVRSCPKCRLQQNGECPFSEAERKGIVSCNKYVHRDAERNKRRWEKYGF